MSFALSFLIFLLSRLRTMHEQLVGMLYYISSVFFLILPWKWEFGTRTHACPKRKGGERREMEVAFVVSTR